MRSHRILHGAIGIVGILHGHVTIAIARLRRGDGRSDARLCGMRVHGRLILIIFEAGGWLGLSGLLGVLPSRRQLARASISSRSAGGVLVTLPLIHGGRPSAQGRIAADAVRGGGRNKELTFGRVTGRK